MQANALTDHFSTRESYDTKEYNGVISKFTDLQLRDWDEIHFIPLLIIPLSQCYGRSFFSLSLALFLFFSVLIGTRRKME